MLRFAADENFNNDILRGLLRRLPELDVVRVQDARLSGAEDADVLEWAAGEGRILLTQDAATMGVFARQRVVAGKPVPGVFEIRQTVPIAIALEDLVLIAQCSIPHEWEDRVHHLPLK